MPADQSVAQQVAALVAIVSIAIIGVAILLIPPTLKGFKKPYLSLSLPQRRVIGRNVLLYNMLLLLVLFITALFGIHAPALVRPVVILLILSILVIYIIVSLIVKFVKWLRKAQPSPKMEPLPFLYTTTLFWIAFCILFCLTALIGVAPTMFNIEIGPYNQDNYNWARWFLLDGILFFVIGVFSFASTYVFQRTGAKKQTADTVKKKPNVVWIVSLIVVLCLLLTSIFAMAKQFNNTESFINSFLSMPLDVKASVNINGTQFNVTNESDFDWENITISLNKEEFSSGYTLSYELLRKGETYTVNIIEFANSDGTRFNTLTMKPLRVSIDVHDSLGQSGTEIYLLVPK